MKFGIIGLGSIGKEILGCMLNQGNDLVFACDVDNAKIGMKVRELTGYDSNVIVEKTPSQDNLRNAQVAIVCTSSRLSEVFDTIKFLLLNGLNVVSTCEELSFPWYSSPKIAEELDILARQKQVSLLGIGVNPGFIMDLVPSLMLLASTSVKEIKVVRSVNLKSRREQLSRKLGVGMSESDAREALSIGKIGHVGLAESACLITFAMRSKIKDIRLRSELMTNGGIVYGMKQSAIAKTNDCEMTLMLEMSNKSKDYDLIEVKGIPPVNVIFDGGISGDKATGAIVSKACLLVLHARKGLITPLELPLAPQSNAFMPSLVYGNSVTS